jgi:excisionase family DNA binding protein
MEQERLLTAADAARRLGVTPAAVVAMERAGKLPARRTEGGMRLFVLADVERLVHQRAQQSAGRPAAEEVAS